jgi:hypothetical protein
MPHQKSSDYKETVVQYYLVEDKTQEEIIYELSYKMGVLNEKRCKVDSLVIEYYRRGLRGT